MLAFCCSNNCLLSKVLWISVAQTWRSSCIKRDSRSMVVFIYHLYIVFWGGYMLPTTFYDNQKQPLTRNGFDKKLFLLLPGAFCSCQPLSWNSRIQRTKQQEVLMSIYTCTAIFQCTLYKPQMPLKISWSSNSSIKNVLLFDDLNESNTTRHSPFSYVILLIYLVPKIHSSESSVSWKKNNTKSMVVQCLTQAFRYHSSMRLKCAAASSAEPLLPCRNLERPNDDVATSSSRHRVGSVGCSLEIRWLFDDCGRRSPANSNSLHHQTWPTWKSQRQKMNRRHYITSPNYHRFAFIS